MLITSRSNEKIKFARSLLNARSRRETGLHRVEGEKLVRTAIEAGAQIEDAFITEGMELPLPPSVTVYTVTESVMEALSDVRTPQGVVCTARTPDPTPPDSYPAGLIAILDRVQDPGNAGTILRTADAMGAACVLFGQEAADPYSDKAIRAAMGSTYHLPVYMGDIPRELDKLKAQGFTRIAGHLEGSEELPALGDRVALVIGSEGQGVSDEVAQGCFLYRLHMPGRAESLNASVAAGILLYECSRRMGK